MTMLRPYEEDAVHTCPNALRQAVTQQYCTELADGGGIPPSMQGSRHDSRQKTGVCLAPFCLIPSYSPNNLLSNVAPNPLITDALSQFQCPIVQAQDNGGPRRRRQSSRMMICSPNSHQSPSLSGFSLTFQEITKGKSFSWPIDSSEHTRSGGSLGSVSSLSVLSILRRSLCSSKSTIILPLSRVGKMVSIYNQGSKNGRPRERHVQTGLPTRPKPPPLPPAGKARPS